MLLPQEQQISIESRKSTRIITTASRVFLEQATEHELIAITSFGMSLTTVAILVAFEAARKQQYELELG